MAERDFILDGSHSPTPEEIRESIQPEARVLWDEINLFIRDKYQAIPQITYSKCSGKPGWNVKFQKSGKAVCTLYPEKAGFVALVVIPLDLAAVIENLQDGLEEVREFVRSAKPFNGTKWLMIPVDHEAALQDVKQLLFLKLTPQR